MYGVAQLVAGVVVVGLGVVGLHFGVEYSGWVLAAGLVRVVW